MMRISTFFLMPALALLMSGQALGHSAEEVTTPAEGAVVEGSPPVITIRFTRPMRITHATLENRQGDTFDIQRPGGMQANRSFEAIPQTLPPGEYRLQWRGLAEDGHVVSGDLGFTVR